MHLPKEITFSLALFFFTSAVNASFFNLDYDDRSNWAINNTQLHYSDNYKSNIAYFSVQHGKIEKNRINYFKPPNGSAKFSLINVKFNAWADDFHLINDELLKQKSYLCSIKPCYFNNLQLNHNLTDNLSDIDFNHSVELSPQTQAVPIPAAMWLFGPTIIVLLARVRKSKTTMVAI